MLRSHPRFTLTYTLFPFTTLFRSWRPLALCLADHAHDARERRIRGGPGRDDFESAHAIDGPGKDRCALCDGDGDALTCNRGLIDRTRSGNHVTVERNLATWRNDHVRSDRNVCKDRKSTRLNSSH